MQGQLGDCRSEFLYGTEAEQTPNVVETAIGADDLRVKKEVTVKALIVDGSPDAINRQIIYFSDWRKLGSCGLVSKDQKELEMSHRSREPDAQS